jgi:dTDP-4-amino-4,6-dideoxygalactose transaminase
VPAVPFHRPYLTGSEHQYVADGLEHRHLRGDGPATAAVAERLGALTGAGAVLLTPSCTAALELAALALRVGPEDEVIMPSFTFVSTANAFVLRGARPVFVDIDPATLNIDPAAVEAAITPRTAAIVVVHYAGVACDMGELLRISEAHGVPLVEDNAHGLGGTWGDRPLGSLGPLGALSFHDTKNVQCGEGGALLVNDPSLHSLVETLREKGTNRQAFLRGEVDKYTWVEVGSSYLLADVLASVLLAQLERFDHIQASRHRIFDTYQKELDDWAARCDVQLPNPPADSVHAAHLYHLLLPDPDARTRFLDHMRAHDVGATFHYVPLHTTELARRLGHEGALPVTESAAARLARLPLYPDLTDDELDRVVDVVTAFRP